MKFINNNFMINNEQGRNLYVNVAKDMPIIDYHCHLDAKEIYDNKPFENITQLWLAGDHYKWRAMRANGVSEEKITGSASAEEKFEAWAATVESSFGNPLYHWTHLELQYYFGIEENLNSRNWHDIMLACNAQLQQESFKPRALISRSNVEVICTTDSPLDTLEYHRLIQQEKSFSTHVLPTFRPDEIFDERPQYFAAFINKLSSISQTKITTFDALSQAMAERIEWFHMHGCRISDHGPLEIQYRYASPATVDMLLARKLGGETLSQLENTQFSSALFLMLAGHYKARHWAMQLHFGAIRNNNSKLVKRLGVNTGFDSVGDQTLLAQGLNGMLDALTQAGSLPKTIVYNLNASYNDVVASAIANFQSGDEGIKSPIQFGSGWWFNDTRRGMENQLNCLADQGLLANFIGMLTDSRSFISYPRHDYFRRILCNLIGGWVARGEVPEDNVILTRMVRDICHDNAERYFDFKSSSVIRK